MRITLAVLLLSVCARLGFAQEIFSANPRGETRNRTYHVLHYDIAVTLHDRTKSLDGTVTTTLVPLVPGLRTIVFDAGEMNIRRVKDGNGRELKFAATSDELSVDLGRDYPLDQKITVSIEYSCTPRRGLTFNNTDHRIGGKRPQIWSQGEDTTNHYWFPCYDYPNDKATCEVTATLDAKYTFLSNGKMVNVTTNNKDRTKTWHWKQDKPISTYLIMIAAGEYTILRDRVGKLPLEFYAYPDDTTNARASFSETASMISFFNKTIGVDFPWDKYAQIILQDHFGGMENVSATTLADGWAVPDKRARIDNPSTSLIAHELAHQWFGDLVTCRNFRDMWLNERFASYYDPLFQRYSEGEDEFRYTMFQDQAAGIRVDSTRGRKPIVSENSYGENVYPRGAAVLHMLRFVLGDQLFQRSIKSYLLRHEYQPVETNDLKMAIEDETGQNLQWFFDEWVYKAGHPVFEVSAAWNEQAREVLLTVKQTQKMDSLTGVFKMPVDIGITTASGTTTHRIGIVSEDSTYALPADGKPLMVIFDEGNRLIKELHFQKSFDEWKYQALHAGDLVDRVLALRALAGRAKEGDVASVLNDRMNKDPFWAVRREAVQQAAELGSKSDSVKELFRTSVFLAAKDARAEVRAAAVNATRAYRGYDAMRIANSALFDSSYTVVSNALATLAKVDTVNAESKVKEYLVYPSHQNRVAATALGVLATLDSTTALHEAIKLVRAPQSVYLRYSALQVMRKYGKGNEQVIGAVADVLNDVTSYARNFAVVVLGDIGNQSVLPVLETIASDEDDPAHDVASASVENIKKRDEGKKN